MPSFKQAFAKARKEGLKEFPWNGKTYNTKIKEEVAPPKRPSSPRPKARPDGKPSVMSEAPKQPKAPAPVAPIKGVVRDAGKDRVVKAATSALDRVQAPKAAPKSAKSPRGGISDWERANKRKPAPKTKGPSVSQIARAIDFQGSGYTDVMRGGPRVPPKKQPVTPRKKGGWGDK